LNVKKMGFLKPFSELKELINFDKRVIKK